MKGKSVFSNREVELIESLIRQRCNAGKSQQKNIRSKMRNLGFYGSDYGVKDMTIEKFHGLIESGQIKVLDAGDERSLSFKNGLEAWVGENPIVLILGTFPGEKSLSAQAYYQDRAHNSFYKIMETLFSRPVGISDKDFITQNHIALWDCMKEADRKGSLDSNIKSYVPNEIERFLALYPTITTIVLNGTGETTKIFEQYFAVAKMGQKYRVISLPSTSNSLAKAFDEKLEAWRIVKEIIDEQIKV